MKDLTRYITREEVRVESKRVRKGELLEKALAIAHRRLRLEYFDTSRIYNGICGYVPLNKLPASGSVPDLICSNHLHEAKNWDTTRYYIDRSKALSEIIPRGSNYSNYTKHLWIPKAKWQSNTKAYLIACGWQMHELPFVVTESNFELAVKWIMRELVKIYNLGYVNSLSYLYCLCLCSNVYCLYSDYPVDSQMMKRSTADREGVMREPLLAEKLINSINSIVLGEKEGEDKGKGGAKATALVHSKEYIPRGYDSLSSKPRKIDPNYLGIYPKENSILLILLEIRNKVKTVVGIFQPILTLASKFVLDISRAYLGISSMLRKLFCRLWSVGARLSSKLASSKLSSKLFMCMSTHYYVVDKHEGRESENKPTTRESCSTRSKARRTEHKQNSKQSTEALPRKTQEREEGSGEATMKVLCPLCNRIGYLEKHGRRYRIRHYVGYKEGRRIYQYHYLSEDQVKALGINEETGYKTVGIKRLDLSSINRMEWAGSLARIGRKPPKLVIVGSNPTPPATAEPRTLLLSFLEYH